MKSQLRVLICGGRTYRNYDKVVEVLDHIDNNCESPYTIGPISCIISGGAAGADTLAAQYAKEKNIPLEQYDASWYLYGSKAGFWRNKEMLEEGQPDLVVAFPGGPGTAHMVKIAKKANVEILEIEKE